MNRFSRVCLVALLTAIGLPAAAESLQCNGQSATEGDSKVSVLYKCGQPLLADRYCAPVYYVPTLQPVPEPIAGIVVPCQPIEEWLYERGPGNMVATVRFRSGVVQSISYGRSPR
ncbi:DUF2845 domain-containing protein [Piscinibacter sp. XHJ-5]|uniref:DUF2845 domain-containing protein n=1 Tax=Piscinibacter sp. XHJ-5 TaxID=3037797 RepID=UPI002452994A|nr:DUF2845 domain-containing protein [Piscinibacter sp. XHJ-5]